MENQVLINVKTFNVTQIDGNKNASGEFKFFQYWDSTDRYICQFYLLKNNGFELSKQHLLEVKPSGFTFTVNKSQYNQILTLAELYIKDFFNSNFLPKLLEK